MKWSRKKTILVTILGLLVAFRIMLPFLVLKYVNKQLAELSEYYGHVNDIDIHLYRGAYVIKEIEIVKINKQGKQTDSIPFFTAPRVDLSVQWNALFSGRVVGEMVFEEPRLNFVKGTHKGEDVKKDTADFRELIDDLMPIKVNRFEIVNGEVHYIDKNSSPVVDIAMVNIDAVGHNLSNVNKENKKLPADLKATGQAYGGNFKLNMNFDALNKVPTFDMSAEMKNMNMTKLNDFWAAYGNFDVEKGTFGMYTEFAAKNGEFGGYVKPFISDLKVLALKKNEGHLPQVIWESIVGLAGKVLENKRTEKIATKIPISGRFDNPDIDTWGAVSYLLRNAFVQALRPSIDNSININKLEEEDKTLLQKIFGKKEKPVKGYTDKKTERKKERQKKREERRKEREKSEKK